MKWGELVIFLGPRLESHSENAATFKLDSLTISRNMLLLTVLIWTLTPFFSRPSFVCISRNGKLWRVMKKSSD